MTTPPVPDDEFYAQLRQGLEHYPEQPADLAGWARLAQSLDAEARLLARRRRRRWFGGGIAVLALLLWLGLYWNYANRPTIGTPPLASRVGQEQNMGAPTAKPTPAASRGWQRPVADLSPITGRSPGLKTPVTPPSTSIVQPVQPVPAAQNQPAGAAAYRPAQPSSVPLAAKVLPKSRSGNGHRASLLVATSPAPRRGNRPRQPENTAAASVAMPAGAVRVRSNKPVSGSESQTRRSLPEGSAIADKTGPSSRSARPHALVLRPEQLPAPERQEAARRSHPTPPLLPTRPDRRARSGSAAPESDATAAATAATTAGGGELMALVPRSASLRVPLMGLPEPGALVVLALSPPVVDTTTRPRPPALLAYRLRLGLVAAPELSAVRPSQLAAPGRNLGLSLDYRLGRRWHLSGAYLQTVKRYVARGTDYRPPADYVPPRTWRIDGVAADCRIADVPLNLRYDLWQRPRYQVFASAGLSSLFMQRETYTYTYEQVSGRNRPAETVEARSGTRHVGQILNLSAGFEHAVGQRWSVQAEPFAKLPLSGIGFGDVRLGSAGVFFSLRYGLMPAQVSTPSTRP